MTDKLQILQCICQSLEEDFALLLNAARAAHEDSINAESQPDNKYDTLSLEASYLAQGQANRAQEIKAALATYRTLELQVFSQGATARLTALVTLEDDNGGQKMVFLGPAAGGLKVSCQGEEIVVITPQSPMGSQLLGKAAGDTVSIAGQKQFHILELE